MPPSKLDKYLNILEVMVTRPQQVDDIAFRAKMECSAVNRCLDFLISNGLAEERMVSGNRVFYAINERGMSVFKTLRLMKYVEKLKKTLPIIEEARQIESILTQRSRDQKEKE